MVEFIKYHYVRDFKNSNYPKIKGLDIKEFNEQISYLKKNYNILSIEDFHNGNYNKLKRNCVLTFDDGYIDHYNYVFEVLVKNRIKGCFFAPVETTLNNKVIDANKIHYILASANESVILKRLKIHYRNLEQKDSLDSLIDTINTSSRYDDSKTTLVIKRLLQKYLPFEIRTEICDRLFQDFLDLNESELSKSLYMNINQIGEMINEGMHFGGHGKNHFWFSSLNRNDQEKEIMASATFLKSLYSKEFLLTMCYPHGDYNNETLSLLKRMNFKLGFTTMAKTYNESDDFLLIPRWDTNDYYPKKSKK